MLVYQRVPNLVSSSRQTIYVYLKIDRVHQIQIYHHYENDYPLVMTNIATVFRWPIEIDGLPFLKMVIFHGELLNNQMVTKCE
jgi:hypothetical protein